MASEEGLRITTWNVNGIRNPFGYQPWREKRTFPAMFDTLGADIVVMQELKIQRKDLRDDMVLLDGWDCFFSLPRYKKGYSGVGIYTRNSKCAPIKAEEGLLGALCPPGGSTAYRDLSSSESIGGYPSIDQLDDIEMDPIDLDSEGRCVILEFPAFVLFGVYSPANSSGTRDDFRFGFIKALDTRIRNLSAMGKRVVLTGDLNVSRDERDSAGAEDDCKKMGVTHDEYISTPNRRIFNQLIDGGEVVLPRDEWREDSILADLCREFHKERKGMYTHWEVKINARPGNYGSRIDYVLASTQMRDWFREADIQEGLLGSDHCPVYAILKPEIQIDGKGVNLQEIMNSSDKKTLPLSGRLLPEFDKRRNILHMFSKSKEITTSQTPVGFDADDSETKTSVVSPTRTLISPSKTATHVSISNTENDRPSKRQRVATTPKESSQSGRNQRDIKSFFVPAASSASTKAKDSSAAQSQSTLSEGSNEAPPSFSADKRSWQKFSEQSIDGDQAEPSFQTVEESDPTGLVEDLSLRALEADASKMQWTKIFSKRDPPRCEGHDEPCKCFETKKKGLNFGRRFWICPRPVGPTGTKENGTQWRCKTFVWASDVGKGEG